MILIRGGTVIDPANDIDGVFDLVIDKDRVAELVKPGEFPESKAGEVIDAKGMWVVPGLIDLHVHLREPGLEWKETVRSGSLAAIAGGFTSICCMPNTRPSNHCAETTEYILDRAKEAQAARVHPLGAVSIDLRGTEMAPLSELRKAGCVAFSDDGEPIWDSGLMRRALEWCLMLDCPISCHEEDKKLSCGGSMNESALSTRLGLKGQHGVAEDVMIARDIELARVTGAKVHICHVSTARGVELIRRAKNDGIFVTAEATPHHLTLTEDVVAEYDTNAKMAPPLRAAADRDGVRAGIKDGTIDCVASDHAPHELDSKRVEFAIATFGILGLQTSLPLILEFVRSGYIPRKRAIELFTAGPARAFGLEYGRLNKGAKADITVIDPEHRWKFTREEVRSLSFNSPFIDSEMIGAAAAVIVDGKVKVLNRRILEQ